jgi:hypothetical protein
LYLHDGGPGFKRGSVNIFDANGFKNRVTYPSAVHQFLSPNDNKVHACKSIWYEEYYQLDQLEAPLRLMQLLDETIPQSKKYFNDNMLSTKKSKVEQIERGLDV